MQPPIDLTIVVPCYNEAEVLPETDRRLRTLLDSLEAKGLVTAASKVCYVDDGSRDATWSLIEGAAAETERVSGIKLAKNRGHQFALLAGLLTVEGDAVVSLDADLQDDPDAIEDMVRLFLNGNDIVLGVRSERGTDSFFKRWTAESYYRLLSLMGVEVVFNHADYRLLSRRALDVLGRYDEANLFLRGIIPTLGFRTATVEYARTERFAGESKYPLRRMLALAIDGVTSFSVVPLRFIAVLGFVLSIGSLIIALWALWIRFFTDTAVPGWASSVLPMYLLGGVQLLSIGVVGEYVAKVYIETKRRPRFVIERQV